MENPRPFIYIRNQQDIYIYMVFHGMQKGALLTDGVRCHHKDENFIQQKTAPPHPSDSVLGEPVQCVGNRVPLALDLKSQSTV